MTEHLSANQLSKLVDLFDRRLAEVELPLPDPGELERSYTSRALRPLVESWVENLLRAELLVRGDGSANTPRALIVGSLAFYPDVEIVATGRRYLAVEAKFLRDRQDPTGSLAKALGQAALYKELGFASSHAVILDMRTPVEGVLPTVPDWKALESVGVHVHWFVKMASNRGLTRR